MKRANKRLSLTDPLATNPEEIGHLTVTAKKTIENLKREIAEKDKFIAAQAVSLSQKDLEIQTLEKKLAEITELHNEYLVSLNESRVKCEITPITNNHDKLPHYYDTSLSRRIKNWLSKSGCSGNRISEDSRSSSPEHLQHRLQLNMNSENSVANSKDDVIKLDPENFNHNSSQLTVDTSNEDLQSKVVAINQLSKNKDYNDIFNPNTNDFSSKNISTYLKKNLKDAQRTTFEPASLNFLQSFAGSIAGYHKGSGFLEKKLPTVSFSSPLRSTVIPSTVQSTLFPSPNQFASIFTPLKLIEDRPPSLPLTIPHSIRSPITPPPVDHPSYELYKTSSAYLSHSDSHLHDLNYDDDSASDISDDSGFGNNGLDLRREEYSEIDNDAPVTPLASPPAPIPIITNSILSSFNFLNLHSNNSNSNSNVNKSDKQINIQRSYRPNLPPIISLEGLTAVDPSTASAITIAASTANEIYLTILNDIKSFREELDLPEYE